MQQVVKIAVTLACKIQPFHVNLFAVKSNTLNRLFHPYGIIRRESKQHTTLQKLLLYSKCTTKI